MHDVEITEPSLVGWQLKVGLVLAGRMAVEETNTSIGTGGLGRYTRRKKGMASLSAEYAGTLILLHYARLRMPLFRPVLAGAG